MGGVLSRKLFSGETLIHVLWETQRRMFIPAKSIIPNTHTSIQQYYIAVKMNEPLLFVSTGMHLMDLMSNGKKT